MKSFLFSTKDIHKDKVTSKYIPRRNLLGVVYIFAKFMTYVEKENFINLDLFYFMQDMVCHA